MAREGATIVSADRDRRRRRGHGRRRSTAAGGRAQAIPTDVGDDAAQEHLIAETMAAHGRIDILHSHAGVQVEGALEQVDPDGMDLSWQINVRAHFRLARLAMPHMRAAGKGSIIVTSSNSGVLYDHEMIAYATSKHAAVAMVKQIAIDYGNTACGSTRSAPAGSTRRSTTPSPARWAAARRFRPTSRTRSRWAASPRLDEIAEAILFLASDRSSFMTGHALVIDGGECIA